MKIGTKEEMGVADKMTSSNLQSRAQILSFSWFYGEKWQQELSEGHENWHEGGDGRCRRNDIFRFGIARAQRAHLCAKRANLLILWFLEEKLQLELSEGHENWHEGGDAEEMRR